MTGRDEQGPPAPPRKVIVGTVKRYFGGEHPGLEKRLREIGELVDEVAGEAARKYPGERLDLIVLTEGAVTNGKGETAAEKAVKLEGPVLDLMGAKAREHGTYLIVSMIMAESEAEGVYSNAAVLLDRAGEVAGIYRKVHPVARIGSDVLEGGVTPGKEFPVFDCDFGRLGIQICYDMSYEDGWRALARRGAEIVALPTASPQTAGPASYAARGRYYVVSSTPRENASVFNPAGMVDAQVTEGRVLVHRFDLSYVLLNWAPTLEGGALFARKYGERVGYTYYVAEDVGVFWSNDPATPIGRMAGELGLVGMEEEVERIRKVQDKARGGPPEP